MHSNDEHEVPRLPRLPGMLFGDRHPIIIQYITEIYITYFFHTIYVMYELNNQSAERLILDT